MSEPAPGAGTGHQRSLASPAFPGDDGSVAPVLAEALTQPDEVAVVAALAGVRVLVPVVAVLGDAGLSAAGGDKDAEMAAVLMTGADGRTALLAFSSLDTLRRWNPAGRPVPVMGPDAAKATLAEGGSAILLDVAGPRTVVVETDDVEHLAAGHQLVRTPAGPAWII